MTKRQYHKKCQKLFCKAKRLGVKLEFCPDYFHHKRLNCLWHGGRVAVIVVSTEMEIELCAYGDVIAVLYDENGKEIAYSKDKSNNGAFEDNMKPYLKTDKQLQLALEEKRLILMNNNWIEYDGYLSNSETGKKLFIDLMVYDNLIDDNILLAIKQVLDSLEEIKTQLLEETKETV